MNDFSFPPSAADAVERVAPSVLGVRVRRGGACAGIAWRADTVVTAAAGLGHGHRAHVVLPDGEAVPATLRGTDPGTDIAVLSVDTKLQPAERRLDPAPRTGDFVFATGRDASGVVHASFGYLGCVAGPWRTWRGAPVDRLLRLDGGLFPGLMGAPIADAQGQVLGMASAMLARHHAVVLPVSTIDRVVDQLLAHGRVARGHLGVVAQGVALTSAMREAAGTEAGSGLLVCGVGEDSPAARAGLLVGDVLLAAGGKTLGSIEDLRDLLTPDRIGSRLRLQVLRGGAPVELSVEVGEQAPRC
ncbi:serine protease [Ramlibacter sp. G-1-2-2]|uniref:Serine protease n=1 Tax=Ramlibacter agri TaxID=2728837 RepID=A0A848HDM6_9BURK|nr:S1C family serine protease [Ramlibacter agri]NML48272.1 serine protease [Ramlibacter agri]